MLGEIEKILAALKSENVRYIIVGGVAAVLHGRLRTTLDLDLYVQLTEDNAKAAIRALVALKYRPRAPVAVEEFSNVESRNVWIREKQMMVFSLWNPTNPSFEVDLFVVEPFPFEEAYSRSAEIELNTTKARVLGLDDLIAMKQRSARAIDVDDVAALQALKRAHEKDN